MYQDVIDGLVIKQPLPQVRSILVKGDCVGLGLHDGSFVPLFAVTESLTSQEFEFHIVQPIVEKLRKNAEQAIDRVIKAMAEVQS